MAKQAATVQRSFIELTVNGMTVRVEADSVLVTKVLDFLTQIGTEPIKKALNRFGDR